MRVINTNSKQLFLQFPRHSTASPGRHAEPDRLKNTVLKPDKNGAREVERFQRAFFLPKKHPLSFPSLAALSSTCAQDPAHTVPWVWHVFVLWVFFTLNDFISSEDRNRSMTTVWARSM